MQPPPTAQVERLDRLYGAMVHRRCRRILRNEEEALDGTQDDPDRDARSWDYSFERHRGGGLFEFGTPAQLVDDPGSASQTSRLRTRWREDSSGRADAFALSGDLDGRIPSVECWDTDGRRSHYRLGSADAPIEEEGVDRDCVLEAEVPRDLRDDAP